MEEQSSVRSVVDYEDKYVNAAVYWGELHEAAIEQLQEKWKEKDTEKAQKFDVWGLIEVRYSLRVLDLRAEFNEMASEDILYAKMVIPSL